VTIPVAPGRTSIRPAAAAAFLVLHRQTLLSHRIVLKDLAFEDPDLNADNAVSRLGLGRAIVDIGAERMQRHAAIQIPFHARDFRAAEAARNTDADALRAKAERGLSRALHRAAESNAALKLLRNALSGKRGIELRLTHLDDVQIDLRRGELRELTAQLLDIGAFLANQNARARRVHRDAALLVRPLDHDLGDPGLTALLQNELADPEILMQKLAVLALVGVPAAIPRPVDSEPEPDRVDFLTH